MPDADQRPAERFNGRISEVVQQTRFGSGSKLEGTLPAYGKTYNHADGRHSARFKTQTPAGRAKALASLAQIQPPC